MTDIRLAILIIAVMVYNALGQKEAATAQYEKLKHLNPALANKLPGEISR